MRFVVEIRRRAATTPSEPPKLVSRLQGTILERLVPDIVQSAGRRSAPT